MAWYVVRRLLQMIPVFLGATLLIYALVFLVPGDPIHALAGDKPMTPAVEAQLRARYHLDRPFIVQYLLYLKGIFTLDFGTAFSGRPVRDELARGLGPAVDVPQRRAAHRAQGGGGLREKWPARAEYHAQ